MFWEEEDPIFATAMNREDQYVSATWLMQDPTRSVVVTRRVPDEEELVDCGRVMRVTGRQFRIR